MAKTKEEFHTKCLRMREAQFRSEVIPESLKLSPWGDVGKRIENFQKWEEKKRKNERKEKEKKKELQRQKLAKDLNSRWKSLNLVACQVSEREKVDISSFEEENEGIEETHRDWRVPFEKEPEISGMNVKELFSAFKVWRVAMLQMPSGREVRALFETSRELKNDQSVNCSGRETKLFEASSLVVEQIMRSGRRRGWQ